MKKISDRLLKFGLLCGLILIMTQCNYRTSSQKRFSKAMDIDIPKNIEVIKDDYQSNWQDFGIEYKIRLTEELMNELSKSIRESKYFNSSAIVTDYVQQDMYIDQGDKKAVWVRTENGFIFSNKSDRDFYSAKVDTVSGIAEFNEAHD